MPKERRAPGIRAISATTDGVGAARPDVAGSQRPNAAIPCANSSTLKRRVALIRDPSGHVTKGQSLDMPDPVVDPGRLALKTSVASRPRSSERVAQSLRDPGWVGDAPLVAVKSCGLLRFAPVSVR